MPFKQPKPSQSSDSSEKQDTDDRYKKHEKFSYSESEEESELNKAGQMDAFHEADPEIKDKYNRANFRVSLLGGEEGAEIGRELGEQLTKDWFQIATGGYNSGTMKAALEGADVAIEDMKQDPDKKKILAAHANPSPVGIVAERFDPIAGAVSGENISIQIEEGEKDIYKRMGKLLEGSSANVLLPGGTGTELELAAAMHFDRKLKDRFDIPQSPLIIVGDAWDGYLKDNYKDELRSSKNVYKVNSAEDAEKLVNLLYELEVADNESREEDLEDEISKHKYTFNKNNYEQ